ncbi:MAG: FHA domain-containing protein [Gammaproteobacteria bacterium]|nr:FHA domain-containing protein [Gammaproteobacteria bacterium]
MAKIIIEEINRLGHVVSRHAFDQLPVAIGRGYQNDLILSDPFVSPEHIIIRDTEDGWLVEDHGSENGVKFKLHSPASRPDRLTSGDDIILGRTRLRLYSPAHPVVKTLILPTKATLPQIIARPAVAATAVILALAILLLDEQLTAGKNTGIDKLLASTLPTFLFALAWAGVWTFVGRVITHRASFLPHFIAALILLMISMLTATLSEYLTYNLNGEWVATIIEFIIVGVALAGLFFVNLSNSTNISRRSIIISSYSVAWSMLLVALFLQYVNQPEFSASPEYPTELKAPFAKLAASKTPDEFLKDSEKLFITE